MKQSFQEKILSSSIPVTFELEPVKVDLNSAIFYNRAAMQALTALSLAHTFANVHDSTTLKVETQEQHR